MMKLNLEELNVLIQQLPAQVRGMMPDDAGLIFLIEALPAQVTEANAKRTMTILSLICRRVATLFNGLATAQEQIAEEL